MALRPSQIAHERGSRPRGRREARFSFRPPPRPAREAENTPWYRISITDHSTLNNDGLADEIATLSATLSAATHRLITLVGEFDRREAWADPTGPSPCRSCAHWLSWRAGIGLGTARQYVRLAKVLPTVPRISEAFSRGELSYSKVRALARIATPELEDDLLTWALAGTASHVEELVRRYRKGCREEENARGRAQREERTLRTYFDDDGMLVIEGRLMPEQGALVKKALERALQDLREERRDSAGDPEDGDQVMADALALVASRAEEGVPAGTATADRFQVMVHVDREVLADPDAAGRCDLADGPAVPVETARRLACEGATCTVTHGTDGDLEIGRKTRVISTTLRRALLARDGTRCAFPGCGCRGTQAHHVEHWVNGGATALENLVLLCSRHHHLVHEGGHRVESLPDGGGRFLDRAGREVLAAPRPAAGEAGLIAWDMVRQWVRRDVPIGPETGLPTWAGERADYDFMADVLRRPGAG